MVTHSNYIKSRFTEELQAQDKGGLPYFVVLLEPLIGFFPLVLSLTSNHSLLVVLHLLQLPSIFDTDHLLLSCSQFLLFLFLSIQFVLLKPVLNLSSFY